MTDLGQMWRSTVEWVDALPLRQRGLVFALALSVVYGSIYGLLIGPLQRHEHTLSASLHALQKRTRATDRQLRHFVNPVAHARALARLQALKVRVRLLRRSLSHLAGGLVPPRDMTAVVRHVLRGSPGLLITRLQNLPAVTIAPHTKGAPVLYRHTLIVVIRGPYPALAGYLERLARQKQRVLWGSFRLKADHYPYSTIRLSLYTLSLKRALLR